MEGWIVAIIVVAAIFVSAFLCCAVFVTFCCVWDATFVKKTPPKFVFHACLANCLRVEGITAFPYICLRRPYNEYSKDLTNFSLAKNFGVLAKHELIHFGQVRQKGCCCFYFTYVMYFFRGFCCCIHCCNFLDSSMSIPYEVEAYARQEEDFTEEELRDCECLRDYEAKRKRKKEIMGEE